MMLQSLLLMNNHILQLVKMLLTFFKIPNTQVGKIRVITQGQSPDYCLERNYRYLQEQSLHSPPKHLSTVRK